MAELTLIVCVALLPFAWRVWVGAGDLPTGDAWAYERIFDTFHRTGHVRLVGWNDITLVGMIPVTAVWVSIAGYGAHQLHLLGSLMSVGVLLGVRSLLVTFGAPNRLVALAVIGGTSGFVGITGTYLSDSFAVCGAVWAVALTCRALAPFEDTTRKPPDLLVTGAALAASFGFLVRQQMAVAAVIAAWLLWRAGARARRSVALFVMVFVVVSLPLYLWRAGLANGGTIELDFHPRGILSSAEGLVVAHGLVLFGGLIWVRAWRRTSRRSAIVIAAISLSFFAFLASTWSQAVPFSPLLSGIQQQWGLDGGAVPMLAVIAAATCGWVWALGAVGPWVSGGGDVPPSAIRRHPLATSVVLAAVIEVAVVVSTGAYFTRYTLFTACLAVVLITSRRVDRSLVAVIATLLLGVTSLWELDHSITPTDAVLTAGRITSCLGIPPDRVDATFSWDGKHYKGIASLFRGDLGYDDGLPPTHDWSTFAAMTRDAVLTQHDPGTKDTWTVVGPIESAGLFPGNRQQWFLTIRNSAIDLAAVDGCAAAEYPRK